MPEKEKTDKEIQIRLKTELKDFSVEDAPFSVPFSIDPAGLNNLVKGLLTNCDNVPEFDWLCFNDLVRGKLSEHLSDREDISTESVIVLEYVEKCEAPKPENTANHDDWVSACRINGDLVLSGCYDNTVNIWSLSGEKKLVIPAHSGPVKAVDWIERTDGGGTFVSASHDQRLNLYSWNAESNSIENLNTCRGHERSVECVAVSKNKKHFVSGSFDNTVKVWGASLTLEDDPGESGTSAKKAKSAGGTAGRPVTRTPLQTLGGHKEAVGGLAWRHEDTEIVSVSWDHTIKIWETELGGLKTELVGNKAMFAVSVGGGERDDLLLTAGAERSIRLYDPKAGNDVKSAFTAHTGWVTAVCWSGPQHFVSASHDMTVRVWDTRSCTTPLYVLTGHSDKVLACHVGGGHFVSGAADNLLKFYKMADLK
eukprot:TRINITY_DN14856_c0_g1_i1.p1 TRINITY_DN14856_c0_g1~~TRINITY_DN14856_c0_g1_i1.p1  ORF type:complete len:424 (+),score=78.62 TRINITY_DN14856_c0_g1_i1:35-1306(+)